MHSLDMARGHYKRATRPSLRGPDGKRYTGIEDRSRKDLDYLSAQAESRPARHRDTPMFGFNDDVMDSRIAAECDCADFHGTEVQFMDHIYRRHADEVFGYGSRNWRTG